MKNLEDYSEINKNDDMNMDDESYEEEVVLLKKKQIKKNAMDRLKEKKRRKKGNQKTKDTKSESESNSDRTSTKSPTGDATDSVSPQKRKGTIWKILFPDKKSEDEGRELERLVCRQVEQQISTDTKVIKCYNDLTQFEESHESKEMSRSEYTKKKNRISAQLSRERREAILHSLIAVCIDNIKAKKELDEDIEEVKEVLKETLCDSCCGKLKGAKHSEHSQKPSTLSKNTATLPHISNRNKKNSSMTIHRPGAWGLLMSFAVIACVLSVAFLDGNGGNSSIGGLPASQDYATPRYLRSDSSSFDTIMKEMPEDEPETVPDVIIGDLLR